MPLRAVKNASTAGLVTPEMVCVDAMLLPVPPPLTLMQPSAIASAIGRTSMGTLPVAKILVAVAIGVISSTMRCGFRPM